VYKGFPQSKRNQGAGKREKQDVHTKKHGKKDDEGKTIPRVAARKSVIWGTLKKKKERGGGVSQALYAIRIPDKSQEKKPKQKREGNKEGKGKFGLGKKKFNWRPWEQCPLYNEFYKTPPHIIGKKWGETKPDEGLNVSH